MDDDAYQVLDFKSLLCFLTTAKHGSLTRAGIELDITEAAVSQRIKKLEKHLGTKLYESPGGRIRLTDAGERTMEMAISLFDQIDTFEEELAKDGAAGTLTVAGEEGTVRYPLPVTIERFTRDFPGVKLRVMTRSVEAILEMVRQGEADLGLIPEYDLPENLEYLPWCSYEGYILFPPRHPLVRRGMPTLEDLLNPETLMRYPLIVAEMGKQAQDRVAEALHRLGLPFNVAFEIGSTDTVKHYVSRGLGVGIVSGICLSADEWQRLKLLELPKEYGGTTEYGVVLRRDKHRSAGLEGFLKLLGVSGKD